MEDEAVALDEKSARRVAQLRGLLDALEPLVRAARWQFGRFVSNDANNPEARALFAHWEKIERLLDRLERAGHGLRFEQDAARPTGFYGYTIEASIRRWIWLGDHLLFEWDEEISGTGQQIGNSLDMYRERVEVGLPISEYFFEELGLTEEIDDAGFPWDYWKAAAWAEEALGLSGDDDEE